MPPQALHVWAGEPLFPRAGGTGGRTPFYPVLSDRLTGHVLDALSGRSSRTPFFGTCRATLFARVFDAWEGRSTLCDGEAGCRFG